MVALIKVWLVAEMVRYKFALYFTAILQRISEIYFFCFFYFLLKCEQNIPINVIYKIWSYEGKLSKYFDILA